MNSNLYITKSGELSRKDNTLLFQNTNIKKVIPVEGIDTIYLFGETSLNTKLLNFLSQKQICLHVFNYYGYYSGSYIPREAFVSGKLLVNQVSSYSSLEKRLDIARRFVQGIINNTKYTLLHYQKHGLSLKRAVENIKLREKEIPRISDIKQLLSIEGSVWDNFYSTFDQILPSEFELGTRDIRPPSNPLNAMISFGNSLIYTQILSQIYQTQLNPTISYLHEPSERRFSLSLDLAELFKHELTFRLIFKTINKNMIKLSDFDQKKNFTLLNADGRLKFLQEFDKRLNETALHQLLKKNVSLKTQMRLECYKLIKHLLGEKEYIPYSMELCM
jgi:CRISPR-associated protein Cas1